MYEKNLIKKFLTRTVKSVILNGISNKTFLLQQIIKMLSSKQWVEVLYSKESFK